MMRTGMRNLFFAMVQKSQGGRVSKLQYWLVAYIWRLKVIFYKGVFWACGIT